MPNIIIANWKMNLTNTAVESYCKSIDSIPQAENIEIIIAPSYIHLPYLQKKLLQRPDIKLAAQDCSGFTEGAYTGDISANMLKEFGCTHAIIGHSERRIHYNENEELLAAKLDCVKIAGLRPIYCVGEDFETRHNNSVLQKLRHQLRDVGLNRLKSTNAIIAYEPIWSIGTGLVPTAEQIQEVAAFIDDMLPGQSILYGGSVNPDNANHISSLPHLSGLLIGKASTNIDQFSQIIKTML